MGTPCATPGDVEKSHVSHHVCVRRGAYLPHWTLDGATYAVVFRLADSLPQSAIAACQRESDALRTRQIAAGASASVADKLSRRTFSDGIERALDAGHGASWLRHPEIAEVVANALRFFAGERYDLAAWCVMPNHVHVVVQPLAPHSLAAILQTWKGYTARVANRLLARTGAFWQREAYDHLIRNETELAHAIDYVLQNPAKAGLAPWPWVWASGEKSSGTRFPAREKR